MATYTTVPASELWDHIRLLGLRQDIAELEARAVRQYQWSQRNAARASALRQQALELESTLTTTIVNDPTLHEQER